MRPVSQIIRRAHDIGLAVPAFNIPYLPMMDPVVRAVVDLDSFALIDTARLEWIKFESKGLAFVAEEFARCGKRSHVRLHLDHVPVIDEDGLQVDFQPIFEEALALGYESVMIDGSRLPLDENVQATRRIVELAHAVDVPVEAELGAVMGHEAGPMPSYEELFESGKGFTDADEACRFVRQTGCDWLSVAIGNVHGAIAAGRKDQKKTEARLHLTRLEQLNRALDIPLVLHGGTGIKQDNLQAAVRCGIAKVNVATEIRQPYEATLRESGSVLRAQEAVYERTRWVLAEFLKVTGTQKKVVSS
jgi:fructose-bisphosphate aldolase, class II